MAFQMPTLHAARVSLAKTVTNTFANPVRRTSYRPQRAFHAVTGAAEASLTLRSKTLNSPRVLNSVTLGRLEKFSTATQHRFARGGSGTSGPRRFGLTAVSVVSAAALSVMAAPPLLDLSSDKTDWEHAKKVLLSMSLQDRQKLYRTNSYISLDLIPVWKHTGTATTKPRYKANDEVNRKISLFSGDITKLEIDAIINAANKTLLGGGGVDGAIHRCAGPLLKKECATLGGCETGEAKITGAYGLPAKHVIHTVGPIAHGSVGERERQALRNCYYNCLHTAVKNKLRTVAFPCISTGVYGYPPEQAVEVALTTVREFLEEHHAQVDRVIFCVFLQSDEELYNRTLPAYFPKGEPLKSKL